ncbi:hypothetical protein [Phycicoccus sp. 3266]|uniref:hypothetical protein n=1 Tax=Phycicoccus sp. 3266 TaxID=2817751 RepID=UPI002854FDAE|nr:hypothetical protein [Phycicoccus sp. 3266]MDR6865004.1 hypothetical protein [Phycicoccus sp. 3266]
MNPTRTTPPHASAVTTKGSRRPGHPAPVPPPGPGTATAAGQGTGRGADPVDRLEGIRVRLAALAPLLQDEPARRLAAVLREVESLVEQLRRPPTGESQAAGSPSRAVADRGAADRGAAGQAAPAPGRPHQAPTAPTTRHRPPALPCGPDYVLLPVHKAS